MFISFLYMFWATKCPSSRETTVFMRHLVLVILLWTTVWSITLCRTNTWVDRKCMWDECRTV